jgi:type II secretory pathway pseudopilin PulG
MRFRCLAFTTVDLLAAVSVLAFGLAIVLPVVAQVRNDSVEKRCADNLRQLGQALLLYANENRGTYPRTMWDREGKQVRAYTNPMALDPFTAGGPAANDVSAALFLLLRTQSILPEVFVCPATDKKPWNYRLLKREAELRAGAGGASTKPASPGPSSRRFRARPAPGPYGPTGVSNFPSGDHLGYSYANPYPAPCAFTMSNVRSRG